MKNTLKKAISILLVAVMVFGAAPLAGFVGLDLSNLPILSDIFIKAKAANYSGSCGSSVYWSLDTGTGTLSITGSGAMTAYWASPDIPWDSYRKSIKTVNISNGVTTICFAAFYRCYNLKSVSIPNSMQSISTSAFSACTSLESIRIPSGVTEIKFGAFDDSTSLTSIIVDSNNKYFSNDESGILYNKNKTELVQYPPGKTDASYVVPDTVTTIGCCAFSSAVNLTNVIIQDGVTSIEFSAFDGCKKLESVIVPNSVKTIGNDAFRGCVSLKTFAFPKGITLIKYGMFDSCTSLERVVIPDSVTSIGSSAFENCNKLSDVYYCGSEGSWNKISIDSDNNSSLIAATKHYNFLLFPTANFTANTDNLIIYDKDTGEPLFYRNILVNNIPYTTSENGVIVLGQKYEEIKIKCDGYYEYSFAACVYNVIKKIYLERVKNDTKPYISTIHVRNMTKDGDWIDIMSEDLFVASNDTDKYEIIIYFNLNGHTNASVFLAQDGNHLLQGDINEGDSVKFTNIQLSSKFAGNMDVMAYIVAESPDKEVVVSNTWKTMLSVDSADISFGGGSYNLFGTDGMSFTLDDDIPVIGGSEISVPFSSMPVSMTIDDDGTYKFAFGIDNASLTKSDWNLIEKATKALQKGQETPYGEDTMYNQWAMLKDYNSALGDGVYHTQFIKGSKFDLQALGYAEIKMVDGSPVVKTGYVGITLNGAWDWTKLYLVPVGPVPIPVYLEFGLNASGGATGGVSRPVADSELPFSLDLVLKGSVGGSVSGGAGIPKVLQLGPKIELKFNYENQVQNKYHKLSMDLYGYIEAKALLAEWKSDKWGIQDRIIAQGTYGSASKLRTMSMVDETPVSLYNGIYNTASYTSIADRDYLDNMEWTGGPTPQLFTASLSNGDSVYEDKTLQTSIYDDSRQQIVEYNGKKIIFWIMDDMERSAENRTVLVYSIYDDGTDSWSEPVSVYDDGTADFYPSVCVTDNDLFVAWHNSKDIFSSETANLDNMATFGEICVAKYVPDNGSFSVTTITNNEHMDTMPVISASSSGASVVWQCNSDNNIFGNTGKNTIKISTFDGENWSAEQIIATDLSAITSIDCYNKSSSTYVAYSIDKDGELSDPTDSEIYQTVFADGNIITKQITNNDIIDSSPSYININGSEQLVWYSNGGLNVVSDLDNPILQTIVENNKFLTDNYSIAESNQEYTYFVWSVYDEVGHASLYALKYDGVVCSEPIRIGETDKKKINSDSLVDENGVLFISYNDVEQEISDENSGVLDDVQTNLSVMKVYEHCDISLSDEQIYYDASDIKPSTTLDLPLTVKNEGTELVNEIDIFINDVLLETRNVELKQGDTSVVNVSYVLPENITNTSLKIKVVPKNDDVNLGNNEITLIYGLADLSVDCNNISSTPLKKILSATIRNNSAVPCGKFTVNIREKSIDGGIIYSETHNALNSYEVLFLDMMFDKANTEYDEDGLKKYYVEVITAEDEYNKFDNFDCVSYTADSSETVKTGVLKTFVESNEVKVYGYIDNNTLEESNGFATITAYDKNGNILGYSLRKIELGPKEMYTVEETIDINGEFSYAEISIDENSNYTYSILTDNSGVKISKYHGTETNVVFPSYIDGLRVVEISENTFNGCTSIVSINIPSYVNVIAKGSFKDVPSLEKIIVSSSNINYCDENGILYNKDKTILLEYPDNIKDIAFEVPNSVKEISDYAFANCNNLNRITVSYIVTAVGKNAFLDCNDTTVVCYMNSAAYNRCVADGTKYEIIPLNATDITLTNIKDKLIKDVTYQFNVSILPDYTDETIIWTSSDKEIVDVTNEGIITPKKAGNAILTVGSSRGNIIKSLCIEIVELPVDAEDQNLYHISDAEDMLILSEMVNLGDSLSGKIVKLDNDVDLTDMEWIPIGNDTSPFSGVFDGSNHTISGLNYESTSNIYSGLFGYIKTGGVKDLIVEGSVTGGSRVGMIAGYMLDSALYNCKAVGEVKRTGSGVYGYVGGLVGSALHSVIINCAAETSVDVSFASTIYYAAVGGIVGVASVANSEPLCILNSYCIGDISVSGNRYNYENYYVGGIAGYLKDDAANNYYFGEITNVDEDPIKKIGYAFGYIVPEYTSESDYNGIGTIIVQDNYYLEGKNAIGLISGGDYDSSNWVSAVSEENFSKLIGEGSLVDELNGNKGSVEAIIVAHRDVLSNSAWAELVDRINGDSFTASSWKIGANNLPVLNVCTSPTSNGEITIATPSNRYLKYGESVNLYAYATGLPEGSKIKWRIVDGSGVTLDPSASGTTCTVTSKSNGNVIIEAYAVNKNGNTIVNEKGNRIYDREGISSEVSLWWIILYYIRQIFGITKTAMNFAVWP